MKDGTPNQFRERCRDCRQWVEAGAGELAREDDGNGGYGWVAKHRDGGCPSERKVEQVPCWAVPVEGRTPAGNQARGYALVDTHNRPPGGEPASIEAHARTQWGEKSSERTAAAWLALWQLDGLVKRTMDMEAIDEALDGFDVGAMRAQVAKARAEVER